MAILDNVTFCYVKMRNPVSGLNEGSTEFTVEAIVSKAAAKAWDKEHVKNKAKSIDTDDFEAKYKCEPPYPEQESQYLIKFKKAHSKNGVELPAKYRPRVFVPVEDGKPKDVTFTTLVQNGSTGKVSFSTFQGPKTFPGEFVQLDAILVEEMIELESTPAGPPVGSDFGADELADIPENQKVVNKQSDADDADEEDEEQPVKKAAPVAAKPVVAPVAKPVAKVTKKAVIQKDDDDEIADSPF